MAAGTINVASAGGRGRRGRRRPVMSDINVTPFVDVMLVLLIVFMVSAPLLTVGVPLELPQSKAKSLQQDNEPLVVEVNGDGQIFLQKSPVQLNELIAKLKAIISARGNKPDEQIYVRGDKRVDYGTMAHILGSISGAGYSKVSLITDVEQGGS